MKKIAIIIVIVFACSLVYSFIKSKQEDKLKLEDFCGESTILPQNIDSVFILNFKPKNWGGSWVTIKVTEEQYERYKDGTPINECK